MIILGSGGGKSGGGGSSGGREASNTLRSRSYVQVLDLVSEGEIEGLVAGEQSIYLAGTPLQNADGTYNYTNFEWAFTPGTHDQAALAGFTSATEEFSVGLEIKQANPYEFSVMDPEIDAVRVRIALPALSYTDTSTGDIVGTTLQYKMEVRQLPYGGWNPVMVGRRYIAASNPFTGDAYGVKLTANLEAAYTTETYYTGENGTPRQRKQYAAGTLTLQKKVNGGAWETVKQIRYPGRRASILSGSTPYLQTFVEAFDCLPTDTVECQALVVSDGGLTNYTISLRVEKLLADAVVTLNDKTTSRYERQHQFVPRNIVGEGPWQVRVTRVTADSANVYLQNSLEIASYALVNTEKLRYPYCALMALRMDAEQFSSIPTRGYHMRLMRVLVPTNYDPISRTYTGMWDGTFKRAWTNNPVWIFNDVCINKRYGAGRKIKPEMLEPAMLYKIAQYCDEMVPDGFGGSEPRFTCNTYLQKAADAAKLLVDLASVFHGMAFYCASRVLVSQDAPRDMKYLFTNASVVDGKFNYSTAQHETRYNTVLVSWNDPTNLFKTTVEYVSDPDLVKADGRVRSTETVAFGCTSRGQARRVGRSIIYSNYYAGRFVNFTAAADGAVPVVGDIVGIQDSMKQGEKRGGRIQKVEVDSGSHVLTLDATLNVPVGSLMYVIDPTAGVQTKVVTGVVGNKVTVGGLYDPAPTADALYSVSAEDIQLQKYIVLSAEEDEKHQYTINAMLHLDGKYDYIDDDVDIQMPDTSNLEFMAYAPPAPAGQTISDTLYHGPGGTLNTKIMVHWQPPADMYAVRGYAMRYRKQNSPWVTLPETKLPGADILDVTDGEMYEVELVSINSLGMRSTTPLAFSYTPLGLRAAPQTVTGLTYSVDPQLGVVLRWDAVSDLDVALYEVRKGTNWDSAAALGSAKANYQSLGFLLSGTVWVKAVDTSGNYSDTAASIAVTLSAPPAPTVTAAFEGSTVRVAWTAVEGVFATAEYEVSAEGMATRRIKGTSFVLEAFWQGSKDFSVRAVDIGGNLGATGITTATVLPPSQPVVRQEVIDNNVLLRWTSARTTLPIATYEVRRGSEWATATVIGKVTAEFSASFESVGGTYNYLVAAYDTAGNLGSVGSVAAQVNQPPDYQLQLDYNSSLVGTLSSAYRDTDNSLLLPINTTETWEEHFTSRGWASPQDQIDAGYPLYLQPSSASGYFEEIVDYGSVLAGTKVTVTANTAVESGSPAISVTISVRELSSDPWIDYPDMTSVFVTNFRYVKYRITVTSSGGDDLARLVGVNLRLDSKLRNDAGRIYVNASDVGGTVVNFNLDYVDVTAITVTPEGTTPVTVAYDFVDVPYPTEFKVLLFNLSGTRVSGYVSWSVKGV